MNGAGREASPDDGVVDFAKLGVMMRAIVIAKSGEGGCGGGEAAEDFLVGRVIAHVGVIDVIAG